MHHSSTNELSRETRGGLFVASNKNSAKFLSALLVSTAFTVPAYAQIETVVVTAERKAEDIQTVPVAVTAFTSADLKSKQVNGFRDLQFHVPSVTYTKSNFGGAQFQIRGITTQFGLGAAIAQNQNDVYIEAPSLVTGQYLDVRSRRNFARPSVNFVWPRGNRRSSERYHEQAGPGPVLSTGKL